MVDAVKPAGKRTYESPKRAAQAHATRGAIIDAAYRLFTGTGYVATTIQAVADEAEVAVQTVYAVFGTKRELLRCTLEAAVSGDAEAEAGVPQPLFDVVAAEPDARRRAELDAALSTDISRRVAPIMGVLREAAAADPEFAATAAAITAQRRADMTAAAEALAGPGGLRVPLEDAVGTLYVLYSPEVFNQLTGDLGWSVGQYERWLARMLYETICRPADGPS